MFQKKLSWFRNKRSQIRVDNYSFLIREKKKRLIFFQFLFIRKKTFVYVNFFEKKTLSYINIYVCFNKWGLKLKGMIPFIKVAKKIYLVDDENWEKVKKGSKLCSFLEFEFFIESKTAKKASVLNNLCTNCF